MKIAFVHWGSGPYPANILFDRDPRQGFGYYTVSHAALRQSLRQRSIELLPHEAFTSSSKADGLVCVDLPSNRKELESLARCKVLNGAPRILIAMESAHSRPELLSLKELMKWDHVFHYSHLLAENIKLTRYCLPSNLPHLRLAGTSYVHDCVRLVGMMGTNKPSRRSSLSSWPLLRLASGYQFSPSDCNRWLSMQDGLRLRRHWARELASIIPEEFRVFGGQWAGEPYAPFHRVIKPKANPCAMGYCKASSISVIRGFRFFFATENLIGDPGYVTEKIFNVIRAGSVPIYCSSGSSCLMKDAAKMVGDFFVDIRDFSDPASLIRYLQSVDPSQYREYLRSGRRFMASSFAVKHLINSYSGLLASRIARVLGAASVS
ncbi:glycosyltransferase family 10 domain-containing protein [Vulcanococcus limneticus]|uniref:glycosyltransferase family 10 domain-containing protein n=1 Tax=Vulcanococcus limneticus TaxID=2170428 RepID=UPI00398BDBA8